MEKRRISIKDLKDELNALDDTYEVQISIGEQIEVINSIFIDTDTGVIELSDFEEEDKDREYFLDKFSLPIYLNSTVLYITFCDNSVCLKCGKVTKLEKKDDFVELTIVDKETNDEVERGFDLEDNTEPHGKIISFKY